MTWGAAAEGARLKGERFVPDGVEVSPLGPRRHLERSPPRPRAIGVKRCCPVVMLRVRSIECTRLDAMSTGDYCGCQQ